MNLVDKAIRSQFIQYFPNPEQLNKRRNTGKPSSQAKADENPYRPIINWFDKGNHLDVDFNATDTSKVQQLYQVEGLHALVKKYFSGANELQSALLMEFILYGLAAYSLISKKLFETKVAFKDLFGSMMSSGVSDEDEDFGFEEDQ